MNADDTIRELFMRNYSNSEIRVLLYLDHGIEMSLRTLQRHLQRLGLNRRRLDIDALNAAILYELQGSGQRLGCRMMVYRLRTSHGINIGRNKVLAMLNQLDPEGVNLRRRNCLTRRSYRNPGPNFLIHIDGYDKLKPYGFAIHGAICGYSRKVVWLKVNRTNNDPNVVAYYFLQYVKESEGVPRCIRVDAGTENTTTIHMQKAMRWFHDDEMSGEGSVIVGSSHSNQRIEAWWRMLRHTCTGFYMDLFKDKDAEGALSTSNPLHLECLRFCFTKLLQRNLDQVRTEWNSHRVRASTATYAQPGKPDLMYYHPELYGARDYNFPAEDNDIEMLEQYTTKPPEFGCTDDKALDFQQMLAENGKMLPTSSEEGWALFEWFKQNL